VLPGRAHRRRRGMPAASSCCRESSPSWGRRSRT